jgi:hypothetical protein
MAVCVARTPPSATVAAGHSSACWLHASGLTTAESQPLSTAQQVSTAQLLSTAPASPADDSSRSAAEGGEET